MLTNMKLNSLFRKNVLTFMLLSLIVILLLGCSGQSSSTGNTEISFAVFGSAEEYQAYQDIVAAFNEVHPEIGVQIQYVPEDDVYRERLATQFSGGQPPDVMLVDYRHYSVFAEQGALEAVGPYLDKSDLIKAADFYEQPMNAFTYKDQLWCIPQNISSLVVYYNKDLFDQAGVPYPSNDWTWDDFLNAARTPTMDVDGDGTIDQYGASIDPKLIRMAPFVWQNGGELVDNREQPTQLTLDAPSTKEAFQWFVNLQVSEHVVPDAVAESAIPGENRFLNGTLGMFFNSRRAVPIFRTIQSFQWDVAPMPVGKQPATILHSDGFCMAQDSEHKDEAWTFIEYVNSVEGQTELSKTGRIVPSVIAVAESPAFLDATKSPANNRAYIDTAATIYPVPVIPGWSAIEAAANREVERAFYGQTSVDEAIQAADQITKEYFARDATFELNVGEEE